MSRLAQQERTLGALLALFIGVFCLTVALALSSTQNLIGLLLTLGLLVATVCFLWPELGLYVLLLSMLLSPEIIVGSLGSGGTAAGRGLTLRLDDFLLLLIALTWLARAAIHKELGLFVTSPLNRPIAAYILIAAVSTAIGVLFDRVRPLIGFLFVLKYAEYMVVFYATLNFVSDKTHLKRLVYVALFTGIVVSLIAAVQIPQGVRASAPFEGQSGEPNTLGGYLLLLIAIFGGIMVTSTWLRRAVLYALGILVMGIPFIYTLSRASYLGMLFVAPVLILLSRKKAIAAFAVFSFFLALLLVSPPAFVERIQFTIGGQAESVGQVTVAGVRLDTSTSARLTTYGRVFNDFTRHPVIGYGVTGYGFIDGQYPRLLIETGLVGLAVFFWLIYALARHGLLALRTATDNWERGLCIGFLAGLAGLVMHAVGANTFVIVRIMEPFWFFAGAITLLHSFNRDAPEPVVEKPKPVSYGLLHPITGEARR
jgi:hypothetical protein